MATARIAAAGLDPICRDIVWQALDQRPDIERVHAWTEFSSLNGCGLPHIPEILLIPLRQPSLPDAMRVLLAAAPGLCVVALDPTCSSATIFRLEETREMYLERRAQDLCELLVPREGLGRVDPRMNPQ
jgi:hypothetical protein